MRFVSSSVMAKHEHEYLDLVDRYLAGQIPAPLLQSGVIGLKRAELLECDSLRKNWGRRLDLELIELEGTGAITGSEFERRWKALWGYTDSEVQAKSLTSRMFVCIDYWCNNEDGSAPKSSADEQSLRSELEGLASALRKALNKPD
jgi:hypothetical protein